jgi:hypothetical protein
MFTLICGMALSMHVGLQQQYNSVHPYCTAQTEQNIIVGTYYNSLKKVSVFGGYKVILTDDWSVDIAVVTGYDQYELAPGVRVNYKDLFIMPALENDRVGAVIGIDIKF